MPSKDQRSWQAIGWTDGGPLWIEVGADDRTTVDITKKKVAGGGQDGAVMIITNNIIIIFLSAAVEAAAAAASAPWCKPKRLEKIRKSVVALTAIVATSVTTQNRNNSVII